MFILRFRPQGQPITKGSQLRDGMRVQYYLVTDKLLNRIRYGVILEEKDSWSGGHTTFYLVNSATKQRRFLYTTNPYRSYNSEVRYFKIWTYNKFLERKSSMANKLLSALKLNKEQRKLSKAGVYDENGNLTQDGQELLLNWLAKENESALVDLVKDFVKDKKKSSSEDSDD